MTMSMNEGKKTARQATSTRRNQPARPVVPPASRAATARKLEPEVAAPDNAELFLEREAINTTGRDQEAELRQQEITRLVEKRDEYVERLDIGAAKIETARAQGKDVTLWEDYWIQLLHQYEKVCDRLRELYAQV